MENQRLSEQVINVKQLLSQSLCLKSVLKHQHSDLELSSCSTSEEVKPNSPSIRITSDDHNNEPSPPRAGFRSRSFGAADGRRLSSEAAYVLFRTRSARVASVSTKSDWSDGNDMPPAGRFFAALQGPELEQLRESEETLLPVDRKWPFLLRFPISTFGVALGLGTQSILWKNLATIPAVSFLKVPEFINIALWLLAALALLFIFATYSLKVCFFVEATRREYFHPVRTNFFFAPWIAAMFLALGVPPSFNVELHPVVCILLIPVFGLELKIYGQWLSGGERRLSKVANPSTHLSVAGNFVGALLAARAGYKDLGIFFWAIGFAHYVVLFVTLYQRLPTNEALPKELHPVFFLFIAAPSSASLAWEAITGEFGSVSRIVFFIALFLFTSLVVRVNFFRGFKFSIAWWAYTFPMTALSIASIHYSQEVTTTVTRGIAVVLSLASSLTVIALFGATLLHLVYWRSLFPNDMAIAITNVNLRRRKRNRERKKGRSEEDEDGSVNSDKASDGDIEECRPRTRSLELLSCFGQRKVENVEN